MRLDKKVALVTGAASGMGRSIALTMAREGARVVLADILDEDGQAVAHDIENSGGQAIFAHLDVTDERNWEQAIAATLNRFGRLDILVNNAGISGTYDPDLTNTVFYDQLMLINAKSVFLGMKHATEAMKKSGGGAIVNLSSISASIGQQGVHIGYGASKAAVKSMTVSSSVHYAPHNIRVNAVAPGMLPPMKTSRGAADPVWRQKAIQTVPMQRAGRVEEVAEVVLFLASDESSYVTGVEILIDGGLLAT